MILGDSAEYDFLSDAVSISAQVSGMCLELGVRKGLGTKTIIDAVKYNCPDKLVVAVDPFGNIPYTGREPVGETHYDYTDDMRNECLHDLWGYVWQNPVDFRAIVMSDFDYFQMFAGGVPRYGYNGSVLETKYSMVHLDAQHTVSDVTRQINWFNERMDSGATMVIDDVTPDFIDIEPIKELFVTLGWELVKMGSKKGLWRKI